MAREDGNMPEDESLEEYSLESILAEYKGTAYINGDKRTPTGLLQNQTEEIIREAAGGTQADPPLPYVDTPGEADAYMEAPGIAGQPPPQYRPAYSRPGGQNADDTRMPGGDMAPTGYETRSAPVVQEQPAAAGNQTDDDLENDEAFLFFENYRSPSSEQEPAIRAEPQPRTRAGALATQQSETRAGTPADTRPDPHIEPQTDPLPDTGAGTQPDQRAGSWSETQDPVAQGAQRVFEQDFDSGARPAGTKDDGSGMFIYTDDAAPGDETGAPADELFEEPDLKQASLRFARECNSISLRCIPAAIITIIMVILTFAFEAGSIIPFGIGHTLVLATGALMLGLVIVMMLCIDIIVRGAIFLVKGAPNAETLLLFSCAFSLFSAAFTMLTDTAEVLPYCAVSALSLALAAIGERYNLRAITESLKTASSSAEPFGVQAEYNHELDKSVLKKAYDRTDGFYNSLLHPDVVETTYRYAAPILLGAALLLSLIAAFIKGQGEYFLHILAALLSAAATFSTILSFSLPFSIIARTIRRSGAAIAGWGGADDICFTDGACVTDDDLFPPGTLKLSGMKVYEDVEPEKAIRYTASLIIASGSGLSHVFDEMLRTQGMSKIRVEDFACYEGGIGALMRGERVATGSAGFMNLLGFRIADDMNMKNAVYTAVNDKLIAVFAMDYTPVKSVQSALISIVKWRIKLFFAVRDFNITPSMLEKKFKVSLDDFAYVQAKDSYNISDSFSGREGRMSAVLTREGLSPFVDAVTGGWLLKSAALVATAFSVVSAALGVIIMFYLCWSGAFASARPGNLILFMGSMLMAVLIVCGYVKCRK